MLNFLHDCFCGIDRIENNASKITYPFQIRSYFASTVSVRRDSIAQSADRPSILLNITTLRSAKRSPLCFLVFRVAGSAELSFCTSALTRLTTYAL